MEVRGNGGEKEKEEGVRRWRNAEGAFSLFSLQGLLVQRKKPAGRGRN